MWIYLLVYLSIPIWNKVFKKNRTAFIAVVATEMFLILALRAPTLGVDLNNYSGGYRYISSLSFTEMISRLNFVSPADLIPPYSYESGYVLLNWILSRCGIGFNGFLILYAAFTIFSHSLFVYRYSDKLWLSMAIFMSLGMYEYFFGILRQTIAVSIMLLTLPAIKEKKPLKFFGALFIAFLFHRSSIIFLPLYFFGRLRHTKKLFRLYFVGYALEFIVLAFSLKYALEPILKLLGKSYSISNFKMNNLILLMLFIAVAAYFATDFDKTFCDRDHNLITAGYMLGIFVQIFGFYMEILSRAAIGYYLIFASVLIPNVIKKYKKYPQIAKLGAIAVYVFLFAFYVYRLSSSVIVPFRAFWW